MKMLTLAVVAASVPAFAADLMLVGNGATTWEPSSEIWKNASGGMCPVEPSRFVREIPPEMYNEHEVRSVSPAYERPKPRGDRWGGWGGGSSRGSSGMTWRTEWRR